jgi:hypothetical protein
MNVLFPRFYAAPSDGVDLVHVPLRAPAGQRRWERALVRCVLAGRSPYPEDRPAALFERMDFGFDDEDLIG